MKENADAFFRGDAAMLRLPWKYKDERKFDTKTLRRNDISLLILDERWNKIFNIVQKPASIKRSEERLKELLKEEARLTAEEKEIAAAKKHHMNNIIKLTSDVFDKNDENAKKQMQISEQEIKRINERTKRIEELLSEMPYRLRQANLELLDITARVVYLKLRSGRKRAEKLKKRIDMTRARLKKYIDEKELILQNSTGIYSYFHDLLGGEELEKLDKEFLNGDGRYEDRNS